MYVCVGVVSLQYRFNLISLGESSSAYLTERKVGIIVKSACRTGDHIVRLLVHNHLDVICVTVVVIVGLLNESSGHIRD